MREMNEKRGFLWIFRKSHLNEFWHAHIHAMLCSKLPFENENGSNFRKDVLEIVALVGFVLTIVGFITPIGPINSPQLFLVE